MSIKTLNTFDLIEGHVKLNNFKNLITAEDTLDKSNDRPIKDE